MLLLDLILLAAVIALAVTLHRQRKAWQQLRATVLTLQGLLEAKPQSNARAIAQWRAELAKYPEGSPKHTAFRNRLRRVGAL